MNPFPWQRQSVANRLGRRLRPRYLRWLARQPVTSVFFSEGWRNFARAYRRRSNALVGSRLVFIPMVCLAACAIVAVLGAVIGAVVAIGCGFPVLCFAEPKHRTFINLLQRDAVALTRLTALQSILLPLLGLWGTCCFRDFSKLESSAFHEKYPVSNLVCYRVGFLYCLACSTGITLWAVMGHERAGYAMAATLALSGCLGWLAWVAGKRLMASRLGMQAPKAPALPLAILVIFGLLLMPASSLLTGSAVLTISEYLRWFGPFGWVNDRLLGLSLGRMENLWPLGMCCIAAVALGHWLNRPTASWAFRRQLLSKYRTRVSLRRVAVSNLGELHLARDLREAISGGGWKGMLCPRWLKAQRVSAIVFCGTVFLVQCFLVGMVWFLRSLERSTGPGFALKEVEVFCAILSCAGGWNVAVLEGLAYYFQNSLDWGRFASRPVSLGEVWRRLQWQGLRFVPMQLLLTVPFIALAALVAPAYLRTSGLAVVVALLTCVAFRTLMAAGACYVAAILHLRQWLTAILGLLGMVAGWGLLIGLGASSSILCVTTDWTTGLKLLVLVLQQGATLAALAIAGAIWQVLGVREPESSQGPA